MLTKSNNPIKSTILFTLLGFLGPAISFFLLPIYLKYLTPEDYGLLTLVTLFGSFTAILADLKLGAALRTFYFDYNDRPKVLKKYLQTIFSAALFLSILFLIFILISGPTIFEQLFKDQRLLFYPFGFLAVLSSITGVCSGVYFIYLKNGIQLKEFAFYSISGLLLTVGFQYYFIVIEQLGALGALMGACVSSCTIFLGVIISTPGLISFQLDKKMLRSSLKFSLPVIPFLFLNWFTLRGDRFIIERFLTLEKVGQYALMITVIGLLLIIMGALDNSIRPFLFEAFKEKEKKKTEINNYILFYIVICLITSSGVILIGHNLHFLTSDLSYLSIIPYFPLACLAVFIRAYVRLFNEQLYFVKRSKDVTYMAIISFIILIVAYLTLLPVWEIWGALIALLVANLINAIIFFYQAQKKMRLHHSFNNLVLLPLITFVGIFGLRWLSQYLGWSNMIYGFLQFIFVVVLLYILCYDRLKGLARL